LWLIFLVDKSLEEGVACQAGGKPIMRAMFDLLLASAILAFRSSAIAAPGDPFGGDDAGCIPPTAAVGRCEDGVQKALTKYIQTVIKCHIKAADAGVKRMPFDEELCESDPVGGKGAKEKYDAAIAKLALGCPACSTANASALRAAAEVDIECHNGDIYCDGTTPSACAANCPTTTTSTATTTTSTTTSTTTTSTSTSTTTSTTSTSTSTTTST